METRDWITIGIALITLINSWCQFWVKERFFSKNTSPTDHILAIFKSRIGIFLIAFTGLLSVVSIFLLVIEVFSTQALTRISCFFISGLTVLSVLNMLLIQSLFTLRRLAVLSDEIKRAESRGRAFTWFIS